MKKYLNFIAIIILLINVACGQTNKNNSNSNDMNTYQYLNDKKYIYGLNLTIDTPFEVYINDIKATQDYDGGRTIMFTAINPYVLKSGKYPFRIVLLPTKSNGKNVEMKDVKDIKVELSRYEKTGDKRQSQSYEILQSYPIPKIDQPVPFVEIKGEFEVDLPYELEGWSNSRVFTPEDSIWLKPKVVEFYEKVRNIFNNGDSNTWYEMTTKRIKETNIFDYLSKDDISRLALENSKDVESLKGSMAALEDYKLVIYGQGRLLTLERINHTEEVNGTRKNLKGKSPLISYGKIRGSSLYPIILHMPLKNPNATGEDRWGELEIIRK